MPKLVVRLPDKPNYPTEPLHSDDRIIHNVTFFGDSAVPEDSEIYKSVWKTANLLAQNGYAIVDGGGPGVMKAATDGAESANGHTVAIYWEPKLASHFEGKNISNITDESEGYSNYMERTLGLIEKGDVYVVCRGGTGTVSEFGMVWALAKLYYGKHKPVILLGEFWKELVLAFQKTMLIDDKELGVLNYAVNSQEVLELIQTFELEAQTRMQKSYVGDEVPFVLSPRVAKLLGEYKANPETPIKKRVPNLVSQQQLDEFASLVQVPAQILQLGCSGFDLNYLTGKYTVTAIEMAEDLAEIAQFENPNADVQKVDIREATFPANTYKGVWARDILQHIPAKDQDSVFKKIADTAVQGAIFYVIVREGQGEGEESEVRGGKTVKNFIHFFSEDELVERANNAGFDTVRIERVTRSNKWLIGIFKKR